MEREIGGELWRERGEREGGDMERERDRGRVMERRERGGRYGEEGER